MPSSRTGATFSSRPVLEPPPRQQTQQQPILNFELVCFLFSSKNTEKIVALLLKIETCDLKWDPELPSAFKYSVVWHCAHIFLAKQGLAFASASKWAGSAIQADALQAAKPAVGSSGPMWDQLFRTGLSYAGPRIWTLLTFSIYLLLDSIHYLSRHKNQEKKKIQDCAARSVN